MDDEEFIIDELLKCTQNLIIPVEDEEFSTEKQYEISPTCADNLKEIHKYLRQDYRSDDHSVLLNLGKWQIVKKDFSKILELLPPIDQIHSSHNDELYEKVYVLILKNLVLLTATIERDNFEPIPEVQQQQRDIKEFFTTSPLIPIFAQFLSRSVLVYFSTAKNDKKFSQLTDKDKSEKEYHGGIIELTLTLFRNLLKVYDLLPNTNRTSKTHYHFLQQNLVEQLEKSEILAYFYYIASQVQNIGDKRHPDNSHTWKFLLLEIFCAIFRNFPSASLLLYVLPTPNSAKDTPNILPSLPLGLLEFETSLLKEKEVRKQNKKKVSVSGRHPHFGGTFSLIGQNGASKGNVYKLVDRIESHVTKGNQRLTLDEEKTTTAFLRFTKSNRLVLRKNAGIDKWIDSYTNLSTASRSLFCRIALTIIEEVYKPLVSAVQDAIENQSFSQENIFDSDKMNFLWFTSFFTTFQVTYLQVEKMEKKKFPFKFSPTPIDYIHEAVTHLLNLKFELYEQKLNLETMIKAKHSEKIESKEDEKADADASMENNTSATKNEEEDLINKSTDSENSVHSVDDLEKLISIEALERERRMDLSNLDVSLDLSTNDALSESLKDSQLVPDSAIESNEIGSSIQNENENSDHNESHNRSTASDVSMDLDKLITSDVSMEKEENELPSLQITEDFISKEFYDSPSPSQSLQVEGSVEESTERSEENQQQEILPSSLNLEVTSTFFEADTTLNNLSVDEFFNDHPHDDEDDKEVKSVEQEEDSDSLNTQAETESDPGSLSPSSNLGEADDEKDQSMEKDDVPPPIDVEKKNDEIEEGGDTLESTLPSLNSLDDNIFEEIEKEIDAKEGDENEQNENNNAVVVKDIDQLQNNTNENNAEDDSNAANDDDEEEDEEGEEDDEEDEEEDEEEDDEEDEEEEEEEVDELQKELTEVRREFAEKNNQILFNEIKKLSTLKKRGESTPHPSLQSSSSSSPAPKKGDDSKYTDFKRIEESINEDTLRFVSTQLETFESQRDFFGLRVTVNCIKSLLQALHYMYNSSKFEDAETAKVLIQKLFFDRSFFVYQLPRLFREYQSNIIPLSTSYLTDLLESICLIVELMNSLSERETIFVLKRSKKKKRKVNRKEDLDEEEELINRKMKEMNGEFSTDEDESEEERLDKEDVEALRSDSFLSQLIHPKIVHHLFFLFDTYSQNSININRYIALIIKIIAFDFRYEHMFFRLSIIRVLEKFLNDPLSRLAYFKEMKSIVEKLSEFLFLSLQKDPMLFIDLLFPKTSGQWRCITHLDQTERSVVVDDEEDDDRYYHFDKLPSRPVNTNHNEKIDDDDDRIYFSDDSDYQPEKSKEIAKEIANETKEKLRSKEIVQSKKTKEKVKEKKKKEIEEIEKEEEIENEKEEENEPAEEIPYKWNDPIDHLERTWDKTEEKKLEKFYELFKDDVGVNPFVLIAAMVPGSFSESQVAFKLFIQGKYTLDQIRDINSSLFKTFPVAKKKPVNKSISSKKSGKSNVKNSKEKELKNVNKNEKIVNNNKNNKNNTSNNSNNKKEVQKNKGDSKEKEQEKKVEKTVKTRATRKSEEKRKSISPNRKSPSKSSSSSSSSSFAAEMVEKMKRLKKTQKKKDEDYADDDEDDILHFSSSEEEEVTPAASKKYDDDGDEIKPWVSTPVSVLKKQFEKEKKRIQKEKRLERERKKKRQMKKREEEKKLRQFEKELNSPSKSPKKSPTKTTKKRNVKKSPTRKTPQKPKRILKRSRQQFDDENEEEESFDFSEDDDVNDKKKEEKEKEALDETFNSSDSDYFNPTTTPEKPSKNVEKSNDKKNAKKETVNAKNKKSSPSPSRSTKKKTIKKAKGRSKEKEDDAIQSPVKKKLKRFSLEKDDNNNSFEFSDDDKMENNSDLENSNSSANIPKTSLTSITKTIGSEPSLNLQYSSLNLEYEPSLSVDD